MKSSSSQVHYEAATMAIGTLDVIGDLDRVLARVARSRPLRIAVDGELAV